MNATAAVTGLRESIQQAESELSAMTEQLKHKRAEIRRYHKAMSALTGQPVRKTRKRDQEPGATAP